MSEIERLDWEQRYQEGEYRPRTWPSPFLEEWIGRFPVGRALDVACGAGRNALRLAEAGFQVEAIDVSASAISMARVESARRGLDVAWEVADLDHSELGAVGLRRHHHDPIREPAPVASSRRRRSNPTAGCSSSTICGPRPTLMVPARPNFGWLPRSSLKHSAP